MVELLGEVGIQGEAVDGILTALSLKDVESVAALLGEDNEAVADLRQLFTLADAYGFAEWLVFDASVVRGLAYYTGAIDDEEEDEMAFIIVIITMHPSSRRGARILHTSYQPAHQ